MSCDELQWVSLRCDELQWVAMSCNELQWAAMSCIVLQWVVMSFLFRPKMGAKIQFGNLFAPELDPLPFFVRAINQIPVLPSGEGHYSKPSITSWLDGVYLTFFIFQLEPWWFDDLVVVKCSKYLCFLSGTGLLNDCHTQVLSLPTEPILERPSVSDH